MAQPAEKAPSPAPAAPGEVRPEEIQARKLMSDAKEKLDSFGWFSNQKFEDAAALYNDAAVKFKQAHKFDESGDAYVKSADLYMSKLNNETDAITQYSNAAQCYSKTLETRAEALKVFDTVIPMLKNNNRFSSAAKMENEVATMLEKQKEFDLAITHYQRASECYEMADQKVHRDQMQIRVAALLAEKKDYAGACQLYEKIASEILDTNYSFNAVDHYFKAAVCHFADDVKKQNFTKTEEAINNYKQLFPRFANSRECKFLIDLMTAIHAGDVERFTDVVFDYNRVSTLDPLTTDVLLQVKEVLLHPSPDAVLDQLR